MSVLPLVVTEEYEGVLGAKHRIVAQYQGTYRPIFWFQVSQDGSIYCAPNQSVNTDREIYTGNVKADDSGVLSINMDDIKTSGKRIEPSSIESFKTSFHGSGVINTIDGRVFRPSIRKVTLQEELCIAFFAHPTKFQEISCARKYDIPLNFGLDNDYPLVLQVSVSSPLYTVPVNYPSNRNDSINMLFRYKGVDEIDKLNLQLSFGMPSIGNWPELSIIAYPTIE